MDLGKLTCFNCQQLVVGQYYTFGNRHFHAICFQCEKCKSSLAQGFYNRGKHLLCEKCYLIVIAHKLTKCPLCKQPVGIGKYIRALDHSWHINCFICFDCKKHLDKEYYNVGEKVYCNKCINVHTVPESGIDKTDPTTMSSATVSKKSSSSQKSESAVSEI